MAEGVFPGAKLDVGHAVAKGLVFLDEALGQQEEEGDATLYIQRGDIRLAVDAPALQHEGAADALAVFLNGRERLDEFGDDEDIQPVAIVEQQGQIAHQDLLRLALLQDDQSVFAVVVFQVIWNHGYPG